MVRSMTAFSRASVPSKDGTWTVEIRSLNHRYFEFSVKLPQSVAALETRIRDAVQTEMCRGKVTVGVNLERGAKDYPKVEVNEDAVKTYLTAARQLQKKFKLSGEISIEQVLKLPGVFSSHEQEKDPEKRWPEIKKTVVKALAAATKAKEEEGRKLASDIDKRLTQIAQAVSKIEKLAKSKTETVFKKTLARLEALLGEKQQDLERVEREVAFLAERSDITEELVRMASHLDLFRSRLKGNAEVGRELDFICQEMNREVNTMASKAQLFEIATEVVFIKGELEKIREQIQNIE